MSELMNSPGKQFGDLLLADWLAQLLQKLCIGQYIAVVQTNTYNIMNMKAKDYGLRSVL